MLEEVGGKEEENPLNYFLPNFFVQGVKEGKERGRKGRGGVEDKKKNPLD